MKQLIQDYIAELKASPLKATMVAVLAVTGLLLWGRLILKEVPRTAAAVDELTLAQWEEMRSGGPSAARLKSAAGRIHLTEPGPLSRNLFALDPSRYRRTADVANGEDGEKYAPGSTEEEVRAAVLSAAAGLEFTSVIEGEEPVVIINRKLLHPGDTVDGFTVLRLNARSVILEKQGVKVRLSL